ncbi:MAG: cyclic nucleotide-binding domain-containing protein [Kofleriaceae bacterium]|nr:cyclic nucleotide-binding domain-containing protein [Kofleriaceae bacterium]
MAPLPERAETTDPSPEPPLTLDVLERASSAELTATEIDVSSDLDTRRVRRLSAAELDVVSQPIPGITTQHARIELGDADGGGEPPDEQTRPDASSSHGTAARPLTLDDEPTRPPGEAPGTTRPSNEFDLPTRVADDHGGAAGGDGDELTRVASDTAQVARPTPWPHGGVEEVTDPRGERPSAPARISKPGMHHSRAFPGSFSETLGEMDPDGAPIETPLDMFSMLPPEALTELERRMTLRRFAAGEVIVREGEPGDACYVIVDGEVRVLKADPLQPEAGPVEVARLGGGSLFGEFALLADRRRHATVQATSHTDLYEIPRQLLRELAASFPGVGPALESFYRQRLLGTLLRTAPFFAPLPDDKRTQLLARFVPVRAESGEPIVREGHPAGGLYLIVLGAVEITKRLGRHRSVILATLNEGAYFGEMSLLSGEPISATVVAAGRVELALLPPRDFYDVVAEHPQLWQTIRREARTRALDMAKILAGETGAV